LGLVFFLIIIFSDMLENNLDSEKMNALFAAIQHLKYNKHEVVIFNVTDRQKELEFAFDNRPHHFIDMESGDEVKVHPGKIRQAYQTQLQNYKRELELKCAQYHIDIVDAGIQDGYYNILKSYLIKRNSMV
jgi:hypothetical protein